ncbi:MAG: Uncharacterized protein G01um101425_903 [Candidatus Peregrinibacteria bacterium Gr01-1014_25]|nr:MAG: Uncharacterized protein G01um101425_903 [Candidatus Peregrinibacteria bacterium Gr01-1014_25]
MPSFSQLRDMYRLQREAKRVKKELQSIHVEAEAPGVKVVVSGEQEVVSIEIATDVDRTTLPSALKDCLNRALKKAQIVASERMKPVMGQMGMATGQ